MTKYIIPLMLLGLALSSYADPPTGGGASESGCYAVSGALDGTGAVGIPLSGAITGDVEGTFANLGATNVEFHGAVQFSDVTQTWDITGGIVEPLIGGTMIFENDFVGIFQNFPIIGVNTKMRVVEGAQKGNLTLHGWTDLSGFPTVISFHAEYHGVICP